MSHPYTTSLNAKIRYNKMLESAENSRRVKKARAGNAGEHVPFLGRLLARVNSRSGKDADKVSAEVIPA